MPSVYQGMYNAITRQVDEELFPALRRLNISFYAYNPLAGGVLSGKYTRESDGRDTVRFNEGTFWGRVLRERYMQEVQLEALELIREACRLQSVDMAEAALRWLIHHSSLNASYGDMVIIGASRMEHLDSNIQPFVNSAALPGSVVEAFDQAWQLIEQRGNVPAYSRGVSGWP